MTCLLLGWCQNIQCFNLVTSRCSFPSMTRCGLQGRVWQQRKTFQHLRAKTMTCKVSKENREWPSLPQHTQPPMRNIFGKHLYFPLFFSPPWYGNPQIREQVYRSQIYNCQSLVLWMIMQTWPPWMFDSFTLARGWWNTSDSATYRNQKNHCWRWQSAVPDCLWQAKSPQLPGEPQPNGRPKVLQFSLLRFLPWHGIKVRGTFGYYSPEGALL